MPTKVQATAVALGSVEVLNRPWKWKQINGYFRPVERSADFVLPSEFWLEYAHPTFGAKRVVPVQGKKDWLGVLPWLWHLVRWTPAGLWCWGSWFVFDQALFNIFADEVFEFYRGEPENPELYWFLRLAVALVVSAAYVVNASRWHIQYLEKQGYKCTGGVEAQTKGEALAKLASQ
jgi:hypothetical protein